MSLDGYAEKKKMFYIVFIVYIIMATKVNLKHAVFVKLSFENKT